MNLDTIDITQKRLRILDDDEIESLYGRPSFTHEKRAEYFSLSQPEIGLLKELRSIKSKVYFILQLGYFKAKYLFFTFNLHEVIDDVQYVLKQHFNSDQLLDLSTVDKQTRLKQQGLIHQLFEYNDCDATQRQKLEEKAQQAAMVSSKPIYIFRELMHYLEKHRIVAPGYSFMQNTVGAALAHEQDRLAIIVRNYLQPSDIEALTLLLEDSPGLYELTQLKREPKDFSASEIKRETDRGKQIKDLYRLASQLLPALKISNESIKYYASLVNYYTVYKLKRFDESTARVYLLCFIYHRYQKLHDNLIACLIHHVRRYMEQAKAAAKEQVYTHRIEGNRNLEKASQILKLFTDDSIEGNTPFREVQLRAFGILDRQKLTYTASHIATQARFDETAFQWDHIDKLAHQFKRNLRPILLAVDFTASSAHTSLIEAVSFLKTTFQKKQSLRQCSPEDFPTELLPDSVKRYLYAQDSQEQKRLLPDRYEFQVYRLLRDRLEAGDVFCRNSVRFRSFEDDLVDDQIWQNKTKLIADTGLAILKQPIQDHLTELEQTLENRIAEVNQRIASGDNKHFKIIKRGPHTRWTLQYPGGGESVNDPFYDTLKQVNVGSVLHFANDNCHFMEAFDHVLGRYVKQDRGDAAHALYLQSFHRVV